MERLDGKCVVLGVTGAVAAYKAAYAASALKKLGANVHTILTDAATEFVSPLLFERLTDNRCVTGLFDRDYGYDVRHISLAKAADVILIAPATANTIAKLASGIADNMLTATTLAARCPKIVAPAMNTGMYDNPVTRENLKKLEGYGFKIIGPESGHLACGETGIGRMTEPEALVDAITAQIARPKTMDGLKVTVTAGPTREAIDPVRFISNYSSGRMGYAIAREAMLRGADVTLVSGPVALAPVPYVKMVHTESAADMLDAIKAALPETDILIKAAAVADYTPQNKAAGKIKKTGDGISLPLRRTEDIIGWASQNRHDGLFICGFSMETENLIENSRAKLEKKNLDMVVANSLNEEGAGFASDTNRVSVITNDGIYNLELMEKQKVAAIILDMIMERRK